VEGDWLGAVVVGELAGGSVIAGVAVGLFGRLGFGFFAARVGGRCLPGRAPFPALPAFPAWPGLPSWPGSAALPGFACPAPLPCPAPGDRAEWSFFAWVAGTATAATVSAVTMAAQARDRGGRARLPGRRIEAT
jgi:hypothetical protein